MRKTHLVLLIITVIMALCSAYSLAAINQVYKIDFDWYSQYHAEYSDELRNTSNDKWSLPEYPVDMKLAVISKMDDFSALKDGIKKPWLAGTDLSRYVVLFCILGEVKYPEYRVKVVDIAQRGNVVEVKVSINSPIKHDDEKEAAEGIGLKHTYLPQDVIRIDRNAFPEKGKLYFIFKSQSGKQIGEEYCDIN